MPNTRDTYFREHPDTRIGLPLHGPVKTTLEGDLAEARATIARLDDETDTLRMELAAVKAQHDPRTAAQMASLQRQLIDQADTIEAYQRATGTNRPSELNEDEGPTLRTRVARALDILHGIEPGE